MTDDFTSRIDGLAELRRAMESRRQRGRRSRAQIIQPQGGAFQEAPPVIDEEAPAAALRRRAVLV